MTGFQRLATAILAAGCLAPGCFAQALIEHAAAAAVGTAGSAGGKALSNALDRIFKQTDAALQGKETKQPAARPEQHKNAEATSASANSAVRRTSARQHSRPAIAGSVVSITPLDFEPPFTAAYQPAVAPPPPITAADLARITPGDTRQQLLSNAGQPAWRVRISGDGHVQEIYRYSSGGADLGSVRVTDGTVTAVRAKKN